MSIISHLKINKNKQKFVLLSDQARIQAGAHPAKKDWRDWTDNHLMLNT
jgi:predicted DNA-binding protein (MmcQ/YjbR family)